MFYDYVESPIGRLFVAGTENGLRHIDFALSRYPTSRAPDWIRDPAALAEASRQLRAYFHGELQQFEIALQPHGTPFQLAVWQQLRTIPYGSTISYGELARRIGNPSASRAVGAANGRNPLPIIVPCHRVIGGDGSMTGFGGGIDTKRALLALESRQRGFFRLSANRRCSASANRAICERDASAAAELLAQFAFVRFKGRGLGPGRVA